MAVPPITIGELNNVPAPLSEIKSNWAQDVSGRVVHRFATGAARDASNLADGSVSTVAGTLYHRIAGVWMEIQMSTSTEWAPFTVVTADIPIISAYGKVRRDHNVVDWAAVLFVALAGWGSNPHIQLPYAARTAPFGGSTFWPGIVDVKIMPNISPGTDPWLTGAGRHSSATEVELRSLGEVSNFIALQTRLTGDGQITIAGRYEPA